MNNIKINIYKNIINSRDDINAWQDVKMFDFSSLSELEITKLKQIHAIDICFPCVYSRIEQTYYDKMINQFDHFVKTYFLKNTSYVYLMEHKLKCQDKIRSYKGLFYNSNIKEYTQKEYLIKKPYSVFAAIALFNNKNTDILNQIYDDDTAFVIHSEKKISEEKILNKIINNYIYFSDSGNTINYSKIISNLCDKYIKICRIIGDLEYEFILQIFCSQSEAEPLLKEIKQTLRDISPEKTIEICYK